MKITYLVALALLLAGSFAPWCPPPESVNWPTHPFSGTFWTLTAMGNGQSLRMVADTPPVTLEFLDVDAAERAVFKGDTGCNTYSGAYEVGPDSRGVMDLRLVDFEITEIGCPDYTLFEREVGYRDTLTTAQTATKLDPRLTIESASGGVLVLDRDYRQ